MEYDVLQRAADFISEFKYTGKDRTRAKDLVSDIHRLLEIHRERELASVEITTPVEVYSADFNPPEQPQKKSFLKKFFT